MFGFRITWGWRPNVKRNIRHHCIPVNFYLYVCYTIVSLLMIIIQKLSPTLRLERDYSLRRKPNSTQDQNIPLTALQYAWVNKTIMIKLNENVLPKDITCWLLQRSNPWPHDSEFWTVPLDHMSSHQVITLLISFLLVWYHKPLWIFDFYDYHLFISSYVCLYISAHAAPKRAWQ